MELEQALFTSTRSQKLSGYHVVARSAGVDETLAQALCRWCPSHDAMLSRKSNAFSINFFPLDEDRFGISRTVLGGPEYSGRGGLQTVTMVLIATRSQLAGYANDPISLLETARTCGYLSFVRSQPFHERAVLPDRYALLPRLKGRLSREAFVSDSTKSLLADKSITLVDAPIARRAVQSVLHAMPMEKRLEISFTTGLKPSSQRPFRIHHVFRPGIDIRAYFTRNGVSLVPVMRQHQNAALATTSY